MTNNPYTNLLDMFFKQVAIYQDREFCFMYDKSNQENKWTGTSFNSMKEQVLALSYNLQQIGVQQGDRVIILSDSNVQWLIADLAIMAIGAISVPTYTTNTSDDHSHIITDSGAKCAFVAHKRLMDIFLPVAIKRGMQHIICMEELDYVQHSLDIIPWQQMVAYEDQDTHVKSAIEQIEQQSVVIDMAQTCCIIYTSGTSGNPNGVMLSHRSILCNLLGAKEVIKAFDHPLDKHRLVSFLPLSHAYEHTTGFLLMLILGAKIYFNPSLDKLLSTISEVKPTFVTCVPRLYEHIRQKILTAVHEKGGLSAKLFYQTVKLGTKVYENQRLNLKEKIFNALLDKVVRQKFRQKFGGHLQAFVSGGAPLNYDVGLLFISMGINIIQGYGQTEASPLISVNPPKDNRIDTVGKPMQGVEVKIAQDGEILVRGDLLMNGYWNQPSKTAQTIQEGWLYTGDVGYVDDEGYIRITDRKKDIIINSGGDNISPQKVEGLLCLHQDIDQCMVYGDRKPHLVAVIVPCEALRESSSHSKDEIFTIIKQAINNSRSSLKTIEQVRNFYYSR